jgi:amino acid transporter
MTDTAARTAAREPLAADAREQGLERRAIGFWAALAMSVAAMGPLLGALSVAPLIVGQAGFSAPFIFIICWIAMGAVALTVGHFSRLLPGAASIYSYVSHGLGERTGFLVGWLSFAYYVGFIPLLLVALGLYGHAAANDVFNLSIAWWVFALAGALIVTTLAIIGIGLSLRIDLTLAVVCDGFLLLLTLIILGKILSNGHFTLAPLSPSHAPGHFTGLSLAIAFGVLIFLGFEQSFVLGEEVTDPHGQVPRAIYTTVALVGGVLFLATFVLVLGFGQSGIGQLNALFTSQGTPWFALVKREVGTGWVDILEILIVFSILSNTIASTNAVVRIQYGMSRAGALPRQLGWTHPVRRTPYVAIIVSMGLGLAMTLIPGLVWTPTSLFAFVSFGIGFAAAIAFIMIGVAALRYFHMVSEPISVFRKWVVPAVAIVALIPVIYTSFYPDPGYPLKWAPRVVIAWLLAGIVYLVWRIRRHEPVDLDYAFREIDEPVPSEASAMEPGPRL